MSPIEAANKWLVSLMVANTSLTALLGNPPAGYSANLFSGYAPEDAIYPFVLFTFQSSSNQKVQDLVLESDLGYLVKGVCEDDDEGTALLIGDQIELSLGGKSSGNWQGLFKMNAVQNRPFLMPALYNGKQYRQSGGFYDINVRPYT